MVIFIFILPSFKYMSLVPRYMASFIRSSPMWFICSISFYLIPIKPLFPTLYLLGRLQPCAVTRPSSFCMWALTCLYWALFCSLREGELHWSFLQKEQREKMWSAHSAHYMYVHYHRRSAKNSVTNNVRMSHGGHQVYQVLHSVSIQNFPKHFHLNKIPQTHSC